MIIQTIRSLAHHVACAAISVGLTAGPTLVAQSIIPISVAYAAGEKGGGHGAEKGSSEKTAGTEKSTATGGTERTQLNADKAALQTAEKALHADKAAGATAAQIAADKAAVQTAKEVVKTERAAVNAHYAADRAQLAADRAAVQAAERTLLADRAAGASAAQIAADKAAVQAAKDAVTVERAAIAVEYGTKSGG